MDWEQTLSDYATHQRAARLSEKTIKNREECLRTVARVSRRGPNDVTLQDLERVLARRHPRTGAPLAAGTLQSERSYMQSFFGWMKKNKRRKGNPAKHLAKVKVPRRKPRPLRLDQIEDVLESGIYSRTRDIILIAAFTGLRLGEVVKLRGEDVDLVGMTIRSIRKGDLDWQGTLNEELIEIARRYPRKGWWFPSPYANEEFPEGGGHILMASASDRVSKAIRAAGISDTRITGHSIRHYAATEMIRRGASVRAVQEFLGHASLATTQLYAEVTLDDMREANSVLPPIASPKHSGRKKREPAASARIAA